MHRLEQARERINGIDAEIARLYEERMRAVVDIAKYKMEHGLPILDEQREAQVIERNASRLSDSTLIPYYIGVLRAMMASSREYQMDLFLQSTVDTTRIDIRTKNFSYPVCFLPNALTRLAEIFSLQRKVLILTDDGVPSEYAKTVRTACKCGIIYTIMSGEGSKELPTYESIARVMVENGFTRSDCVVAVGGGVVTDLGGFVASTYMRGIDFYAIPTTTLAMVDASVGGKCAVNFMGGKNLLGAFYPPRGVLIDRTLLRTLSRRQMASGLAEAVKMAATLDGDFFRYIEECEWNDAVLDKVLYHSILLKKRVVEEDERESGKRKLLNFGHTLGHAIEMATDGEFTHGECIALGMLAFCSENIKERLLRIYKKLGLPTELPIAIEKAVNLMALDKKRDGDDVDAIFVDEVGFGRIERIALSALQESVIRKYKGEGV
ncbi:MAG: 3-dehydroquinate synthase [Clostridia bacterium]|nr:3-dehydroquinate synthase [Clostridia bacterium]